MLQHRQRHGPRFAFGQQVLAAHQPLQLREFADHLADQIVLAQMGGAACVAGRLALDRQGLQEHIHQPLQPCGAVAQAAEAFGEGDPLQLVAPVDAGHPPVGRHEELRIRQARPQHPLVAAPDRGGGLTQAIADAQEARQQAGGRLQRQRIGRAASLLQGHIALMGAHHRAQHLRGQRQEALLNGALDHPGGLHQIDQFVEQGLRQVGMAAAAERRLLEIGADGRAPCLPINQHAGGRHGRGVGRRRGDLHLVAVQAMAAAEAAAHHLGIAVLQPHRHHRVIEKRHQPADRAAEAEFTPTPAHEAPALQSADPARDQIRQHLRGGAAARERGGEHERAFGGLAHLQLLGIDAATSCKADGRRRRLAVPERLLGRRTLVLLAAIALAFRQARHQHGQTPGRPHDLHRVMLQPLVGEALAHRRLQLGHRQPGEIGGKFLGADLQQEGGHGSDQSGTTVCNRLQEVVPPRAGALWRGIR